MNFFHQSENSVVSFSSQKNTNTRSSFNLQSELLHSYHMDSAGTVVLTSSGSEGDERYATMDERKRKRMMSNRESARRSRMRKEQHMKDLNNKVSYLKRSNNEIVQEINTVRQLCLGVESDNMVLRAQLAELKNRLESLEIVLSYVRGMSGCSMAISQDHLLKPLQVSCQSMPLTASVAGIFQF